MIKRKLFSTITAGTLAMLLTFSTVIASVIVQSGPSLLFASAQTAKANSSPLGLFALDLSQNAGESLSSITLAVNNVAPASVVSSDIANVSVYKDNGDNVFDSASDLLAGTQASVNIGSDTTISTVSNNSIGTTTNRFFISLQTGSTWSSAGNPDTVTVTFPSTGLIVSGPSIITVTPITTPNIQADTMGPMLTSVVAQDTAATATKTAGDSIVFNFNEATNHPTITAGNIMSAFSVNNGHTLLNGDASLGTMSWNGSNTALTLTFTSATTLPTVALGDTVGSIGTLITDAVGNFATGTTTVSSSFGASTPALTVNGPTPLITSPYVVKANSAPVGIFWFGLTQDGSHTLNSVTVRVNNVAPAAVTSSDIASLKIYKDNGDGVFNSASDMLAGTQTTVNIGSDTMITTASNNQISNTTAGNKFFVALQTSGTWTSSGTPDTVTVNFPANGVVTSSITPTLTPAATNLIMADTIAPTLMSVVAQNTGGTNAKEAGDRVVFSFSEPTNHPTIDASNIMSVYGVNNGHTLLNGDNTVGTLSWNPSNTMLTLTFTSATTLPTIAVGDTVTVNGSTITDIVGNAATGSQVVTGSFGGAVVQPPTNGSGRCANGLINGRLYFYSGNAKIFLAAGCKLKVFKGNAVGHAKGKKFQALIPLPTQSIVNGQVVNTFSVIQLNKKPQNEKKAEKSSASENSNKDNNGKDKNKSQDNNGNGKANGKTKSDD